MQNELLERKKKLISFLKERRESVGIFGLIFIIIFGFFIRLRNLPLLKDVSGAYVPGDPDAAAFLRYAKYILENGSLMDVDFLRYYPLGFSNLNEFGFLSYYIAYLYKFLHFFNSDITIETVAVVFPAINFGIALMFFYLLVRKLFNFKVALLASAFLSVMPHFLYRTISGVGDKEALGIIFFFAAFYFYILGIKSEKKYGFTWGLLSGVCTALLGLTWGGVSFVFLILGVLVTARLMLNNLSKNEFYVYVCWWFATFIVLNKYSDYYEIKDIFKGTLTQVTLIGLLGGFVNLLVNGFNFLNLKNRLKADTYPIGILSVILFSLLGVFLIPLYIALFVYKGDLQFFTSFFYSELKAVLSFFIRPFGQDVWAVTVAESKAVLLKDWLLGFGEFFFIIMLAASVYLFYNLFKSKQLKWTLTSLYMVFLGVFFLSNYSSTNKNSLILNWASIFIFGLVIFCYYIYGFYLNNKVEKDEDKERERNREIYQSFKEIPFDNLFLLTWFIITLFSSREAFRLVFMLTPIASILGAYILIKLADTYFMTSDKLIKFFSFSVVFLLLFVPFVNGSLVERTLFTLGTSQYVGIEYDIQWQNTMKFIKEKTPKESVFAHWWDYGYWIQSFGERATLSDGGNARGAINYFIGRYLLTGTNKVDALELLKTHGATHLLMSSDEVGKYQAFSNIGSDNGDRSSIIDIFKADPQVRKSLDQENNEILSYLFAGNFPLDEDLIINGRLFPKGKALVAGSVYSVRRTQEGEESVRQPVVIVSYLDKVEQIPLNCLYLDKQEYIFSNDYLNSYDGCLVVVPTIGDQNQIIPNTAAIILSPKVRSGLFAQLYLLNKDETKSKEWAGFKKIYDDTDNGFGLIISGSTGRVYGPIKIWEVSYSNDIKENPRYLSTEL